MEAVSIAINAAVVAAVGIILGWLGKGRLDAVDRRMDRIESRLDAFQASLDSMRSDLTRVALALGVGRSARNG